MVGATTRLLYAAFSSWTRPLSAGQVRSPVAHDGDIVVLRGLFVKRLLFLPLGIVTMRHGRHSGDSEGNCRVDLHLGEWRAAEWLDGG